MTKYRHLLGLIVCLSLTGNLSAQIVTHQATPKQVVTTGHESAKGEINFTELANYYAAHPQPLVVKMLENEEDNSRPAVEKPFIPSLVHTRSTPPHSSLTGSGSFFLPISPAPVDTFESTVDNNTSIPPDTHGDVGGNYCVTAINSTVKVQNRTGGLVSTMSLDAFWTAVLPGGGSYDPRVFYDRYTDRWYLIADGNAEAATSSLLMAVSKTNNPAGAWYEFIVPVGGTNWIDYPTVGYNKKWIAVGGNPFSVASNASAGASMFIFNKALLLAGTSATFTRIDEPSSFTICPAVMYDTVDQNLFAAESWDGTAGTLQLWKITGPVGTPAMTVVGQPSSAPFTWQFQASVGGGGGDFAPQIGTTNKLQCNDDRVFDLKYINGNLWCSHNVFLPATGTTTHCSAQWWQFDTLANPIQIGYVNDNSATNPNFYYFPAIAVNKYNDVLVGFTTSSALTHANAAYALHLHTDPTDSTRPAYIYRHGQAAYYKTYGGSRDRWGDYSQSSLDTNNVDFWTIQETVATGTNEYDTWWAYVKICVPPVATITPAGATTVCSPATVLLNANTGTGLTYQWEVGGTAISGATTSSYTATVTGTYNVIVYNSATCDSVSLPVAVSVNPLPGVITGSLTVCAGSATNLTDGTAGGTWSSTTTGVATISSSGVVTGAGAGTATISYTLGTGCAVTAIVTVNALPGATITPGSTTTFCTGGSVVLNANTGTGFTYQWQLGGSNIVGATNSTYTATTGGNYVVIVSALGCSSTSAITTVTVGTPPGATITPGGSTTFCTGGSVILNANTGAGFTYQWQLGGSNIVGATNASYTASTGGNYTVIVYSGGCSSTSSITTVTVTAGPGATITPAGATTFCAPGSVVLNANTGVGFTYQWQVGGVNITGATLATYTASATGNYAVIVTSGACVVTSAVTVVTVNTPPTVTPIGGATTNVCNGQTIILTDATAGGTWSSSNTGIATVGTSGVVTGGASTGTVLISYTVTNSCGSATASIVVTVNTGTSVSPISGSLSLCTGNSVSLSDATAGGAWSSGNTAIATVSTAGIVTGVGTGADIISYTVTNISGCISSAIVTVNVVAPFTATITPLSSTTFCAGGYVVLSATTGAGYTYQWQLGGVNIVGATSSTYSASAGGNYTVIINNTAGCFSTSAGVVVTISSGTVVVPSVSISASLGTVLCTTTTPETFTATPVNGGGAPTYQWYINGVAVGTGAAYSYSPANGDIVKCVLTSNAPCAFPDSAVNSVTMSISPLMTPSVSITSIHSDSTCIGDTVQFAAVPVYGGTAPTYLWTENGINVATGPYYIYAPTDGDTLIVTMTSNYPCLATPTAVSSIFIVHVFPPSTNTLSVFVSQSSILSGRVDTFTAVATGAGSSPSFQWFINGTPVAGATSSQYITDSLRDGQIVNCEETSSFVCSSPHSIFSGGITITVLPNNVQQVGNSAGHFTLLPNPNRGEFTINGTTGTAGDDKVTIVMSDVLGQTIFTKTALSNNGNVSEHINLGNSLANGNYMVTITSGEDHIVFHVTIDR